MGIFGWIIIACIIWWVAHQYDKKMNQNFMSFLIRMEQLENQVRDLKQFDESKENEINHLKKRVIELEEKVSKLERPYQKSILDD